MSLKSLETVILSNVKNSQNGGTVGKVMKVRVSKDDENEGLDITEHGERAFVVKRPSVTSKPALKKVG